MESTQQHEYITSDMQSVLDLLPHATIMFRRDANGNLTEVYVNERVKQFFGKKDDQTTWQEKAISSLHPEDSERVQRSVAEAVSENRGVDLTYRIVNDYGKTVWVHHVSNEIPQPDGSCLFCAVFTDVTAEKAMDIQKDILLQYYGPYFKERFDIDDPYSVGDAMRLHDALFRSVIGQYTTVELTDLDADTFVNIGCLDYVENILRDLSSTQAVLDCVVKYLVSAECQAEAAVFYDTSTAAERLRGGKTLSLDYNGSVGGWLRGQIIPITYHEDGRGKEALFTVQRIHDEKMEVERLRKLSETDGLSQLLNRDGGMTRIEVHLADEQQSMFCLFDVDNFKHYNDRYGHVAGDEIIQTLGNCMRETFRNKDVVMRVGGDEFGIYIPHIVDKEAVTERIREFEQRVETLKFSHFDEPVSISAGVAFSDECQNRTYDELFKLADERMYEHKREKKNTLKA